jgi:hypothetical protein
VPLTRDVAGLLRKHQRSRDCPLVFPSPFNPGRLSSPSFLHDLCKDVARRAKLNDAEWHLHRFRDTALASRRNRRQNRASVARPRIARRPPGSILSRRKKRRSS